MHSLIRHRGSGTLHHKNHHRGAAPVQYDDDFEKDNASLHVAFNTVMETSSYYKESSFYKKVKCLLISWDKDCDDIHTDEEVSELAAVLEGTFHYKVIRRHLNSNLDQLPHHQLMKYTADFLFEEDAHGTLLLVYYAGHGSSRSAGNGRHGLTLFGQTALSDSARERNEIVWGPIEDNLQHTKGDVLEIFDCCYAGDLGYTRQPWSHRSFEFLGACSSGNTTLSPGPGSFTRALIWALESLAEEERPFVVSQLSSRIREAPNFPNDQVPVQLDRGGGSIERIMLAALPQHLDPKDDAKIKSDSTTQQGLLHLNFIFDKPPTKANIRSFGNTLNRFMWREKMPVNRIVWGGLTSWEGVQQSPGAQKNWLHAAKRFKAGADRRKSLAPALELNQEATTGLQTPQPSVEEETRSPSAVSDTSQPMSNKRKACCTDD